MTKRPIVILQMLRMGDLILTFPLMLWLERQYPGHPIWVVAEPVFFKGLTRVSPPVRYIGWEEAGRLTGERFELVLNLSHRAEAAELAGRLAAERKLGPVSQNGVFRILGDWQLYRASLTGFNRHNRFHWAELNALDAVSPKLIASTAWGAPRHVPEGKTVGLFVGASEEAKRPSERYYVELLAELESRGLRGALFGGPAEKEVGERIRAAHGSSAPNYCGKLSLAELTAVGQTLSLFVTPDTGPMHLAAWGGLTTLNISMGPVNPWETGPYQPGHWVLRPSMSCSGCWSCARAGIPCRERFSARTTAFAVSMLLKGGGRGPRLPGLAFFKTSRKSGLYELERVSGPAPALRDALGAFWQAFFGHVFGLWDERRPIEAWRSLEQGRERAARAFLAGIPEFGRRLRRGLTGSLDEGFWSSLPSYLRPLASYQHMLLQNGDYAPAVRRSALDMLDRLAGFMR